MTDWGLNDCRSDPQNGAYGGMIEKLIRNNLSVFFLSSILTRLTAELESYVPPPKDQTNMSLMTVLFSVSFSSL